MDVQTLRKLFVAKVSWGPTKISFGDAIRFLDEALVEAGFSDKVAPVSHSPALDGLSVPAQFRDAADLAAYVAQETAKGKTTKTKAKVEKDSMVVDEDQENEGALKATGVL